MTPIEQARRNILLLRDCCLTDPSAGCQILIDVMESAGAPWDLYREAAKIEHVSIEWAREILRRAK